MMNNGKKVRWRERERERERGGIRNEKKPFGLP
jgi:hypothetical protein